MPDENWRDMPTAPRDGTIIEIRNTYGVKPWYGLVRWTNKRRAINEEEVREADKWTWVDAIDQTTFITEESSLTWRPYPSQDPTAYIDPTQGAQDTNEYWGGRPSTSAKTSAPVIFPGGSLSFIIRVPSRQALEKKEIPQKPTLFQRLRQWVGLWQ